MSAWKTVLASLGLGAQVLRSRWSATRPFKVTWMLTERCDCRCQACFIWQRPKAPEASPDEIGRVLAAAPSIRWVNLTGGEPFLRDDLVDVARAAYDALPDLTVLDFPTTGQRTDRILTGCAEIAALGIPRFYVTLSIEGPPATHVAMRGRPDAWDNLMRTYAALRELPGVAPYLGMTLSDRNAHLVDETLDAVRAYVPDVGWRDLHLNVYTVSGHYYDNTDGPLAVPDDIGAAIQSALRSREGSWDPTDVIEAAYLRHLPTYLRTGRSPLPCQSLKAGVFIGAQGDLHPCTVWGHKLGNVFETPLYELLERESAREARAVIARDACPGCWSPCEAHPTIVANAPASVLKRPSPSA